MATLTRLLNRLMALVHRERSERELTREVEAHLALLEDDFVARGLTADQARVAARRAIGGVDQTKERHRDARSFPWLEDLRSDVPYALRGLTRDAGFTTAAVFTLALGIGATTAVFSVVNAVLLRPLPYKDSDQLVRIVENRPARTPGAPPNRVPAMPRQQLVEWQARTRTLSAMVAFTLQPQTLMQTSEAAVRLTVAMVTTDFLSTFGAQPILGRVFDAGDAAAGHAVVLSARAWSRYFQSDPGIIGRTVSLTTLGPAGSGLDGQPGEIIGVLPADFDFPSVESDFWAVLPPPTTPRLARSMVSVVGRLADGVSIDAARDEANVIGNALAPPSSTPAASLPPETPRFEIVRIKDQQVSPIRPALRVLAVAVGVVLLIVCANVANLLLARGTTRQREIAVRLAIGASRGRIVRQVLAESLMLAIIGGLLSVLLAMGGVHLLKRLAAVDAPGIFRLVLGDRVLPRLDEVGIDATVLLFALAVSAATAITFGMAPALQVSRADRLGTVGSRGSRGGAATRGDTRVRSVLVVGQLTLATMLLVAAGLLTTSFVRLSQIDPGYQASRILTFYLLVPERYPTPRKAAVIEALIAGLRTAPNVDEVGFSYGGPLLGVVDRLGTLVPAGRTIEEMKDHTGAPFIRSVSHGYLQAMGVRLLEGRLLDERDDDAAPSVLVLNRTAAQRLFPGESAIGKLVLFDGRREYAPQQIVGVVEDMRTGAIDQEPVPQMFVDYRQLLALTAARGMLPPAQEQLAFGFLSFAVRAGGDPASVMPHVRSAIGRVDPAIGIDAMIPMERLVASSLTRQRFFALLVGLFAVIALVLGAIGIYGVLAYAVLQRTQEIGIRMALGAKHGEVLRLVLRRGILLTSIGITLGIAGAAGAARFLAGMLYGLTPLDPTTYVVVAALFALVALLASYLPARRATQVDPMVALRCE